MITSIGRHEEDFMRLRRLVLELWSLLEGESVACVKDCLAAYAGVTSSDDTVEALLAAVERCGLLSRNNVLVLRHVSELVGCGGALRLVGEFELQHPPVRQDVHRDVWKRPAHSELTLSTWLSPKNSSTSSSDSPPPFESVDSFKSALDNTGLERERCQTAKRCSWVWPVSGAARRPAPPSARYSVRDVLEQPWDVLEQPWDVLERPRDVMERPRDVLERRPAPAPRRSGPAAAPQSTGVIQEQLHWREKVLGWDMRPAPRTRPADQDQTAGWGRLDMGGDTSYQRLEEFENGEQPVSGRRAAGYVTCC